MDIMIDIETLATHNNAVITQLAFLPFNPKNGEFKEGRMWNFNIQDMLNIGLEVDGPTIEWWMQQHHHDFLKHQCDIEEAFEIIIKELAKADRIWCHATFDMPLVINMLQKAGYDTSCISFRKTRDLRTICDLANINFDDYPKIGNSHNALDDCRFQIQYCVDALKKLTIPLKEIKTFTPSPSSIETITTPEMFIVKGYLYYLDGKILVKEQLTKVKGCTFICKTPTKSFIDIREIEEYTEVPENARSILQCQ